MTDMNEIGNAFLSLGRALKANRDMGLDKETLSRLLELAPVIIAAKEQKWGPPKWSEEKDPVGALIIKWLRTGQTIPSGNSDTVVRNALTRLRRNGVIINRGSRSQPQWDFTTEEERKEVVETIKAHRDAYERSI